MASTEMKVDVSDLHKLADDCRTLEAKLGSETRKTVHEAAAQVWEEARKIAADHSKSIPPTIKLIERSDAAMVQAGSNDVPLAVLYELGNKGGGRKRGYFKHPVFGNKNVWVEQRRYPFLRPALTRTRDEVEKRMELALEEALRHFSL